MKAGRIGTLAGSAALLLYLGCASGNYAKAKKAEPKSSIDALIEESELWAKKRWLVGKIAEASIRRMRGEYEGALKKIEEAHEFYKGDSALSRKEELWVELEIGKRTYLVMDIKKKMEDELYLVMDNLYTVARLEGNAEKLSWLQKKAYSMGIWRMLAKRADGDYRLYKEEGNKMKANKYRRESLFWWLAGKKEGRKTSR